MVKSVLKYLVSFFACTALCLFILILCNLWLVKNGYKRNFSFYDFVIYGKDEIFTVDKNLIYTFRKDEFYKNYKPPDINRRTFAFVGDSVTYSFGSTSEDSTYPLRFEKLYNEKHQNNQISVYNYGVPGYGIDQEYILIKEKIINELKPEKIIWNINENDLFDNMSSCLFQKNGNNWSKLSALRNIGYWYGLMGRKLPTQITSSNIYNFFLEKVSTAITKNPQNPLYTFGCSFTSPDFNTSDLVSEKIIYLIQDLENVLKNSKSQLIITIVPYQSYFNLKYCESDIDYEYYFIKKTIKNSGLVAFLDFNETILNNINGDVVNKYRSDQANCSKNQPPSESEKTIYQDYFLSENEDRNNVGLRHPNQTMYDLMAQQLLNYIIETTN